MDLNESELVRGQQPQKSLEKNQRESLQSQETGG